MHAYTEPDSIGSSSSGPALGVSLMFMASSLPPALPLTTTFAIPYSHLHEAKAMVI